MEIIPDPIHSALLTLPFLVALVSLHVILWRPLLAYLDERDQVGDKARHEAHELEASANEQVSRIEARLAAARAHVIGVRQEARKRALGKEQEIVAESRAQADKVGREAVERIADEQKAASEALRASVSQLSDQIAGQVLGRPVARG